MYYFKVAFLLVVFLNLSFPASAKIYKYQTDGVKHFSDNALTDQIQNKVEVVESTESNAPLLVDDTLLHENYAAKNAIERATAATVTINSIINCYGFGSGFFITENGYILTSKRVIIPCRQPTCIGYSIRYPFSCIQARLKNEKRRLKKSEKKLKKLEYQAQEEPDPKRQQFYEKKYQAKKGNYDAWVAHYTEQSKELHSRAKRVAPRDKSISYYANIPRSLQSFTITIVNGEELYVRLVAVSTKYDLALLKLDGYKTPMLTPKSPNLLVRGDAVYAIGGFPQLSNTILWSSGKFLLNTNFFIHINSPITHNNNGGPLIDLKGKVLGINTQNRKHKAAEGEGSAISILIALEEFKDYLP